MIHFFHGRMSVRRAFKLLFDFLLAVAVVGLITPGAIYITSLALLPRYPSPPVISTLSQPERQAWVSAGGNSIYQRRDILPMTMVELDPWIVSWHLLAQCKHNTGKSSDLHFCAYYFPGFMPASEASRRHYQALGRDGAPTFWHGVSEITLAIWITRHWSSDQLAAYLASTE